MGKCVCGCGVCTVGIAAFPPIIATFSGPLLWERCVGGEGVGVVGSPCLQSEEGVGDCGECVG